MPAQPAISILPPSTPAESDSPQICCLLIHGFNALPAEFDALAGPLMDRGFSCRILHLPRGYWTTVICDGVAMVRLASRACG
jgi:hypothetical protein